MKLLMFRMSELSKPSNNVTDEIVALATRMDIGGALRHLNDWRVLWISNNQGDKIIQYSLLAVSEIGELTPGEMKAGNIQLIEDLEIVR